jgi:hypothetical protein
MLITISFPKDKEELKRKKMEMQMKKINSMNQDTSVDMSNINGAQRMVQITDELNKYYQDNKEQLAVVKRGGSPKQKHY